ncbi:hypothetical protein YW5DRAFT_06356 [Streptomyces sp. Ncost-T6T-1]|uniref:hypothetical protein n=1 Tax=Streptomyces sp. Ncost-T6T-1 TaxID=1100828 RepID=UPI0008048156|nr:hypothetical protein [Streptomyces sp. Ncost-T6T-1]SBU99735.1 hypothetical protein YW5DRAFT_06356 [Streptomyces sp. Ncost-T6T-1]
MGEATRRAWNIRNRVALSGSYVWAVFLASAAGAIADGVGLGRAAGELLMERGFGWAVAFLLVLTWTLPAMGPRLVGPDEVLRPLSRSARVWAFLSIVLVSLFAVGALAVLWREGSLGESLVEVVRSMVSDPALGVFLLIAAGYAFTSPVVWPTGAGLRGLLFPGGGDRRR